VQLVLTDEQEMLREVIRQFTRVEYSHEALRQTLDAASGYNAPAWKRLAREVGIAGLGIPEEYGGAGGGLVEVGIVLEELGRNVAMTPLFATQLLAATLLLQAGDVSWQERYLPAIATGELTATVTVGGDNSGATVRAQQADGGWRLNGTIPWAVDADTAGVVFVLAEVPDGHGWFAVDRSAEGLTTQRLATLDATRPLASIDFRDVPATLAESTIDAMTLATTVTDYGAVGLAAEQVGMARGILDIAVAYAKTREQYGRPIGSFQAIKHRCAEMLVRVEAATSTAYYALLCAVQEPEEFPLAASTAKVFCGETGLRVAADAIQVHGGIGFTWEHPAHYYFKRAKSTTLMFGDPGSRRALVAKAIGLQ
jgi:alkylation response protein AidB-like acyl-CoA dehydrogenase